MLLRRTSQVGVALSLLQRVLVASASYADTVDDELGGTLNVNNI